MKELTIGDIIKYQINKKSITPEKLTEGLCTTTSLKRLINGDTRQSFFLVERTLQRLGISVNKVTLLHNESDDTLFIMREMICKLLVEKAYAKAEYILSEYEMVADLSSSLHLQYVCETRGVILSEGYGKHEEALELYHKAFKAVLERFEVDKLSDFLLGEEEMILLMLMLKEEMKVKNTNISVYARQLLDYVEKQYEDEEVRTNIYTKLAWLMGESAMKNNNYEEALELTLGGIEALTDNGLLLHLPQFLDRLLFLTKGRAEDVYSSWKKKRDALKELYVEYNEPWQTEDIRLWESYRQNNIYLISELLRDERDLSGYSQEELAEAIGIDVKTISRIENGKSTPKKATFASIKEHFDLEGDSLQTRLAVDSPFLLEMERDISRLTSKHQYKEAEILFKSLKKQLSMESKVNRQYVAFMEALFDNMLKRKPVEEVLADLEDAFLITRKDKHLENLGRFVTTDLEAKIINMMAVCYKQTGHINKSVEILENAIKGYKRSKIDEKKHEISFILLSVNLCTVYEEMDRFEESISLTDKTIRNILSYHRGHMLGILLLEKVYTQSRILGNAIIKKDDCEKLYLLMELMKSGEKDKAPLSEAYKEWYGEDISNVIRC